MRNPGVVMNKSVFLVSPSIQENVQLHDKNNSYGLGLGYLHAVIETAGYLIETKCYNNDSYLSSLATFEEKFREMMPDYLLVQMFTMNRVMSYRTIKLAKSIKPDLVIIAGGVHASILYQQLLENYPIDAVVIGEGEETIIELLNAFDNGATLHPVKGIAYKDAENIRVNSPRELIADLDSIPFPRHDLFINPERELACLLTTRGCPFRCNFCCLFTITKRKYRRRSAENVIAEIAHIVEKFPQIKTIQLSDDTFTLDLPRAIAICNEISRRKFPVQFTCSARFKPASRELFQAMEKAGFSDIGFGLETGSEKLLKSIHKNITQQDVLETFEMIRDSKIKVTTLMMVGFPGESDETVSETISLIKKLQKIKYFEFGGVARLWVYPGTEVYDIMKEKGLIDDSYWLTDQDVPHYTADHSLKKLSEMVIRISLSCMTKRQLARRIFSAFTAPKESIKSIYSKTIRVLKGK